MNSSKKKTKVKVKKVRIAVLGPSYVGKTQLVNRFVNNSFSPYYEPTIEPNVFRRAYNLNENEEEADPKYYDLEIVDLFPHDHPFMNEDPDTGPKQAQAMLQHLKAVINTPYADVNKPEILDNRMDNIHAYMFVFDSSNKRTFDSLMCII